MNEQDRATLTELRKLLLQLHKTLLDWQRAEYEQAHGRMQTTQLLHVMMNDAAFAWLRSMSGLIVRIDEALDTKTRPGAEPKADMESGPLMAAARELLAPEAGTPYAQRYHAALQELPDAVLAHRDLITLLKLQRPASNA